MFFRHLFIFRGHRGNLIKMLWADEDGLCRFVKRLERGRFIWPALSEGKIHLTSAQLAMLLEGLNWIHSYSDCIRGTVFTVLADSRFSAGLPRISASMAYSSPMRLSTSVVMSVGVRA